MIERANAPDGLVRDHNILKEALNGRSPHGILHHTEAPNGIPCINVHDADEEDSR